MDAAMNMRNLISAVLIITAVVLLPMSAVQSAATLISNVRNLNLTASALGILSTLNPLYFIGLVALIASLMYSRNITIKIISAFMLVLYLVGYPLLMSPYPPYLPDGTLYATESLAVSIFGYSSIAKFLYNGGAYPTAFIWGAMTSIVTGAPPIRISSIYGLLEPIALALVAYIVGKRAIDEGKESVALAVIIYTALIWSFQFHFSPQDFNIVTLMLTIPLIPMLIKGDLKAVALISLVAVTLTLSHQTEDPILLASLLSLLILRLIRGVREFRPIVLATSTLMAMNFIIYSNYIIPVNISIISSVFSISAIERLTNLLFGRVSHAVYFAVTSHSSVYPLRSIVYHYELYGGYVIALLQLIATIAIYLLTWFENTNEYRQAYASLALGGMIVIILITLALGTYSNRGVIYVLPILSGLLLPYLARIRNHFRIMIIIVLIALGFIGLIFSGSTIYWDYSAGNPITYTSYGLIFSLGYHYNVASYYTTNWLTYYELLSLARNINITNSWPYIGSLFDFNKNDLLFLANDVNMARYYAALNEINNTSIVYNDGLNIVSVMK